jgi:hypothetical protein
MTMQEAIPVECNPVRGHPDKVRLVRPDGAKSERAFSGWFNRYHLAYAPESGFVDCGEYDFFYHTAQHYTYGVCRKCGEVYVKPTVPRPPRNTTERFMEGALRR